MNITSEVVSKSIRLFSYISLAMFVKFHYGTFPVSHLGCQLMHLRESFPPS